LRTRRARALAIVGLVITGSLTAAVVNSPAARADATVHTLVLASMAYAPYQGSESGGIAANVGFTISCYVTGDSVTGPYGSENVWDLISGGNPGYVSVGLFVPDADVWTGSNSPVVPRCSTALGKTINIGNNPVNLRLGAGTGSVVDTLPVGEELELKCYTTSTTPATGPYGTEYIWDQLPNGWWVPDAQVYTGSNSAVVPHC
jgi:uncharacterized protein YraI